MNRDSPSSESWSIGDDALDAIVEDARPITPRTIVEFGSGQSSLRLARAFPHARILSLESSPQFYGETRALIAQRNPDDAQLRVELRPLRFQRHGLGLYESYTPEAFPDDIDMVLIDGPPHWTRRGREACLYQVAGKLRVGARIYLDDFRRNQEQRMVRNWMRVFPGQLKTTTLEVGHRLCVLETRSPLKPRLDILVGLDAIGSQVRRYFQTHGPALGRRAAES